MIAPSAKAEALLKQAEANYQQAMERIAATAALAGFEVRQSGGYPGWKPEPGSAIVALVDGVHRELFGKPMVVKAIHAGLECGIIGEKYPGMDMVSFGPTMSGVHSPEERLEFATVPKFYEFLLAILKNVK